MPFPAKPTLNSRPRQGHLRNFHIPSHCVFNSHSPKSTVRLLHLHFTAFRFPHQTLLRPTTEKKKKKNSMSNSNRSDVERGGGKNRDNNYSAGTYVAAASSTPYYFESTEREWTSWIVPMFVIANIAVFVVTMFVNNCPKSQDRNQRCVARFLGRFSFEPLKDNPLFGPSSLT